MELRKFWSLSRPLFADWYRIDFQTKGALGLTASVTQGEIRFPRDREDAGSPLADYDEKLNAWELQIAAQMPFLDKSSRNRKVLQPDRSPPNVPMGDQRFRQLMSEIGAAFAQADDGEEKRRQVREGERQHEQWLAQRKEVIVEIVTAMRQHGLSIEDLT